MSRGRKPRVTEEKYLKAVRRTKSTGDTAIGNYIGVTRQAINNFKINNPKVYEKALEIISKMESMRFDSKYVSREVFRQLPVILNWNQMMIDRPVKLDTRKTRMDALYNVCKYLMVHPESLSIDQASKVVKMMKKLSKVERMMKGEDGKLLHPEYVGLAYYYIRKPIRSYFQLIRGISAELLTTKGIDAGRSEGTGKASSERVTKEQRSIFEEKLRIVINSYKDTFSRRHIDAEFMFREILGVAHFMYYTATRIGVSNPTEAGTISIMANNPKHRFESNLYKINLLDKGKANKYIEWDKILMDDGIIKFNDYVTNRFDIQKRNLNIEMSNLDTPLFPTIQKYINLETKIMKETHKLTGCITTQPNHIWRHTFAQDCLNATDWNYELVATLGGWKNTETMKLSYGKMNQEAIERGLRRAMKLPVKNVTYKLLW